MACRCQSSSVTLPFPPFSTHSSTSLTTALGFVAFYLAFLDHLATVLAFPSASSPSSGSSFTVVLYALPFTFCGSADFDHFGNHVICPFCNAIAAVI